MISDRRRIECAIYPRLFARWMASASDGSPDDLAVLTALREAEMEALGASAPQTVINRLIRLSGAVTNPLMEAPLPVVFLAMTYALHDDLEEGALVLREGSAFDRAFEAIKAALLAHEADPEIMKPGITERAEELSQAIRRTMRDAGYFKN
jgi:hypothetical protein